MPRNEVFTLKHPEMVARHEAFVRKVVGELKEFDNLYFEICNEPYFGGVTLDWQARIAADDRRGRGGPASPAHDRPEHRQRLGQGRRPEPGGLALQLPLRPPPAGDGRERPA